MGMDPSESALDETMKVRGERIIRRNGLVITSAVWTTAFASFHTDTSLIQNTSTSTSNLYLVQVWTVEGYQYLNFNFYTIIGTKAIDLQVAIMETLGFEI
jgi:hypothetical protein